jgi:putative spermidine/putrescine transport system permease protein
MSGTPRVGAESSKTTRYVILIVIGAIFAIPIISMIQYTFRDGEPINGAPQKLDFQHYLDVFNPANEPIYDQLFQGIQNSLVIALFTVIIVLVLLLPTMILVELQFPRFRKVLEFICLLPVTIPTIVLVVGFIPVYSVVAQIFGSTPYTLAFAIGAVVLPYAYRPIAANLAGIDVIIMSEAARSLGASWLDVLWRVILPNLRRGIFASIFITIAVVLGEYTIAAFLSQNTFQTALLYIQQQDPYVAVIFAVLALIFVTIILVVIGRLGTIRPPRRARKAAQS